MKHDSHRLKRPSRQSGSVLLIFLLALSGSLLACDGCKEKKASPKLTLPFTDNFDRQQLGAQWRTDRPGRWQISHDAKTNNGRLCGEQARNNHIFLQGRLPDNVVVEFDAWGLHPDGDIKMELFSDGQYPKTGYALVQGGWVNRTSIIDRLGEHNNKTRSSRGRIKGKPLVVQNQKYHWKVTRFEGSLKWYLDGKLYLEYKDKLPLKNPAHAYFAFGNWIARTCFDNLRIDRYQPSTPAKAVPKQPAAPAPQPARRVDTPPPPVRRDDTAPAPARVVQPAPRRLQPLRAVRPRPMMLRPLRPLNKPLRLRTLKHGLRAKRIRYLLPTRRPINRR